VTEDEQAEDEWEDDAGETPDSGRPDRLYGAA